MRLASSRGLGLLLAELNDHSAGVAAAAHLAVGAAPPAHSVLLPVRVECVLAAVVVAVLLLPCAAHAWLAGWEWAPLTAANQWLHHPPGRYPNGAAAQGNVASEPVDAAVGQAEEGGNCAAGIDVRCDPQVLQLLVAAALACPSEDNGTWVLAELLLLLLCGCGPCGFTLHGIV